jgi:hypothetical protein
VVSRKDQAVTTRDVKTSSTGKRKSQEAKPVDIFEKVGKWRRFNRKFDALLSNVL